MKVARLMLCASMLLVPTACGKSPLQPAAPPPSPSSDVARIPPEPPAGTTSGSQEQQPPPPYGSEVPPATVSVPVEPDDPMAGQKELASLPDAFYGTWRLTASGGGFDGHADPPPRDGEMIVITKSNRIESWKGGKLVSTEPFRITRGRSIFGNDNWLIYRGGIGLHVIRLQGSDLLDISENHVECQSWSYARVLQTSTGG